MAGIRQRRYVLLRGPIRKLVAAIWLIIQMLYTKRSRVSFRPHSELALLCLCTRGVSSKGVSTPTGQDWTRLCIESSSVKVQACSCILRRFFIVRIMCHWQLRRCSEKTLLWNCHRFSLWYVGRLNYDHIMTQASLKFRKIICPIIQMLFQKIA